MFNKMGLHLQIRIIEQNYIDLLIIFPLVDLLLMYQALAGI